MPSFINETQYCPRRKCRSIRMPSGEDGFHSKVTVLWCYHFLTVLSSNLSSRPLPQLLCWRIPESYWPKGNTVYFLLFYFSICLVTLSWGKLECSQLLHMVLHWLMCSIIVLAGFMSTQGTSTETMCPHDRLLWGSLFRAFS